MPLSPEERRRRARCRVKTAALIKKGLIQRGTNCELCGGRVIQAHHDDYDKPEFVRWLCTICHGELHGIERRHDPTRLRRSAVSVQLFAEEHDSYHAAAETAGLALSEWVRQCLNVAAERSSPAECAA